MTFTLEYIVIVTKLTCTNSAFAGWKNRKTEYTLINFFSYFSAPVYRTFFQF